MIKRIKRFFKYLGTTSTLKIGDKEYTFKIGILKAWYLSKYIEVKE